MRSWATGKYITGWTMTAWVFRVKGNGDRAGWFITSIQAMCKNVIEKTQMTINVIC